MKLLTEYFRLQEQIYKHFGYVEDWRVIPLDDGTSYYWLLVQNRTGGGTVWYSDVPFTVETIKDGSQLYSAEIYTQRFLKKWVYRADDYTMVCVDTRTDGNKFLMVFDNAKELINPSSEILAALQAWG